MKYPLGFLAVLVSLTTQGQTNPFDTLRFDKVVMCDFNEQGEEEIFLVDKNGRLDKSVTKQVDLSKETIIELNKRLGSNSSYVRESRLCFVPHLGFVYYNRGKVVASIVVCLMCHGLRSSINIPAQIMDQIEDNGKTLFLTGGMSDSMAEHMNTLVKSN